MSTQAEIIFNRICQEAAGQKASEIYLLPAQIPFIRVDGQMQPLAGQGIISTSFMEGLIDNLLKEKEQIKLKEEKQIDFIKEISRIGNSQINIYFTKGAPALRIKLLSQEIVDLSSLELPVMAKKIIQSRRGIVFITGPRDSGRSSLVASILNDINKHQAKFIATVEKPIRATLNGIKGAIEQREVGRDVNSFLDGLAYIRTRNADVIMVDSIKDEQTMDEIFAIAEAGSLVFTILDTESTIKTLRRVLHLFPASKEENIRYLLSENLAGVISTHLVPKIGGGRIRVFEILPGTPVVNSIIAAGKFHQLAGVLQTSEDKTAISLDQYLANLVSTGKVMGEEALKHCLNEELFKSLLRR